MSDFHTFINPVSNANDFNRLQFAMRRFMAKVRTATPCQVVAVSNAGEVTPVGTVDVQPLVYLTDGQGNITPMPMLYDLPYIRIQGGTNAVIIDPQVGDIGMAVFADRDISSVIATKKQAVPGSNRRNSVSDGMFINGTLNGTPTQYVQFNATGINVVSPNEITIQAPTITLKGAVTATSTVHVEGAQTNDSSISASGEVIGKGIDLSQHVHPGVQSGSSSTQKPAG